MRWLLTQGVEALETKENALARLFYETVREIPGVRLYGDFTAPRAPIVSLNLAGEDSARVADALWEEYGICVRAGAHCAPLMHRALGTVEQGVVRFSFSHTNTREETLGRCLCGAQPCGGINNACKETLYRVILPYHSGSDGMGKTLRSGTHPRAAHSAGPGSSLRVRPCVADAAEDWPLWQSRIDPAAYDAAAVVEQ